MEGAMSESSEKSQELTLTRETGYRFRVRFGGGRIPDLVTDEPAPVGAGMGPSPSMLLGAAIANCLASSLVFCLGKARIDVPEMEARVEVVIGRNPEGRMRIRDVRVRLAPTLSAEDRTRMSRCLDVFESFCMVTESVRAGIPVQVEVLPETAAPHPGSGVPCVVRPANGVRVVRP